MTHELTAVALATLAAAAVAMSLGRLLHSVLVLTLSWLGVALFYLLLGAEFVAFAQALIYLGAISMAVLFALLLTRRTREEPGAVASAAPGRAAAAVLVGAAVAATLLYAAAGAPADHAPAPGAVTVRDLGLQLMGAQAPALLIAGVLLTAALVGAVVLAADDTDRREDDRP
jgi:NADH:ubiquinone oxidoreductase subunit 6 (subunit J)